MNLIEASREGDLERVKELVATGADVNLQSNCGNTALMVASRMGHIEIVRELLVHGASTELQNDFGQLAVLCVKDNLEIAKLIEIVKWNRTMECIVEYFPEGLIREHLMIEI